MIIVVYSKPYCTFCIKAKELLNRLQLNYDEKVLDVDYTRDDLRTLVYGDNPLKDTLPLTVPQIFVNGYRVGGYEELVDYCDNMGLANNG